VYARYQFRILRVADFQRELEAYTGQSWQLFFERWLYGAGMTDWAVEQVKIRPLKTALPASRLAPPTSATCSPNDNRACRVTVLLHQKADYNESTVLGFCFDGGEAYQLRIPIEPQARLVELDDPPAHIESLPDNRVRVEIVLPCKPTQIAVDPDQVLLDCEPSNNYWKPRINWRFTPLYTPLEETDVTTDYDRWNVIVGPGFFGQAYNDPWYTRSAFAGLRAALYRTQQFAGGAYVGYRTDDRDIVAGVDGIWSHWPWPHTQVGFNIERSLTSFGDDRHADRGVVFGRYVFQYSSSLYLPPMHYAEVFGAIQDDNLPLPRQPIPGTNHFDHETEAGIHYHIDYLTPYWDPEGGFRFDAVYTTGIPILGEHESFNRVDGQISTVKYLPEWLGPLSQTRLAARLYGATGVPTNGEFYTLGGGSLFRGFDLKERQGSSVWVGSLEWRIPLVRQVTWDCCDHVAGVRNIYAAPFYDVGNAYVNAHPTGDIAHALGAGLRVDIAWFSMIERTTIRFDVAKTLNSSAPVQFWFGVQHPF
jgi:hypothetical protein